jgi:glycosyltransferase involved in cell wall biosynthesis
MKILNFISGRNLGGSKQAFLDFSIMCHQAGFEVHSMIRTRAPIKSRLLAMPDPVARRVIEIDYFRLLFPPFKQWALKQFKKATQQVDPQVIIVHKPIDVLFMRLTYPHKPIVSVIHSFTSKYLQHADLIFAVSESLKAHIVNSGIKTPVVVINNSTPMVPLVETKQRAIPVIGTMAVFRKTKRLDILLRAFKQLKQRQAQEVIDSNHSDSSQPALSQA